MLVFVWMCVMAQALSPSTAQLAHWSITAYQAEMRGTCEGFGSAATKPAIRPARKIYPPLSAFAR